MVIPKTFKWHYIEEVIAPKKHPQIKLLVLHYRHHSFIYTLLLSYQNSLRLFEFIIFWGLYLQKGITSSCWLQFFCRLVWSENPNSLKLLVFSTLPLCKMLIFFSLRLKYIRSFFFSQDGVREREREGEREKKM